MGYLTPRETTRRLTLDDSRNSVDCPHCGCGDTHQGVVTVYSRGEDCNAVHVTQIVDTLVSQHRMLNEGSRNPSVRRDGLRIAMDCEGCGHCPDLLVYQHKGITIVEWDDHQKLPVELR